MISMHMSSSANFNINETKFRIWESGYTRIQNEWRAKAQNPPYSRLYYTISGKGKIKFDNTELELSENTVCFLPTGKTIDKFCSQNMDQLYFHINMYDFEGYDILRECKVCQSTPNADIQYILSLYKSEEVMDHLKLKQILEAQCLQFMNQSSCTLAYKKYSPIVKDTVDYIKANLSLNLSVQYLADRLFISKCALNNRFRKETGKSVGQFIDEAVLEQARYMLATEKTPISEISEKLGFCDQFYFSKKFSCHYGGTPSAYRKNTLLMKD